MTSRVMLFQKAWASSGREGRKEGVENNQSMKKLGFGDF